MCIMTTYIACIPTDVGLVAIEIRPKCVRYVISIENK